MEKDKIPMKRGSYVQMVGNNKMSIDAATKAGFVKVTGKEKKKLDQKFKEEVEKDLPKDLEVVEE